jgi:uncharacterized protein YqiB (DUF1249 family)
MDVIRRLLLARTAIFSIKVLGPNVYTVLIPPFPGATAAPWVPHAAAARVVYVDALIVEVESNERLGR